MRSTQGNGQDDQFQAFNYCMGFIDLLGQRDAMRGQNLIPAVTTEDERREFVRVIRESVGSILLLQEHAEGMLETFLDSQDTDSFAATLPPDQRAVWQTMNKTVVKNQRWSDGLTFFSCLGDSKVSCVMNGVFGVLALCGSLCLLGLVNRRPVRGAVEIAWGMELRPDELYGPVVARAYELESEIAQYPRIVVGPNALDFLMIMSQNDHADVHSQLNKSLATLCLRMLQKDTDGYPIIHYLGEAFRESISQHEHIGLYDSARAFAHEQHTQYRQQHSSKLAFRYDLLCRYFEEFKPKDAAT